MALTNREEQGGDGHRLARLHESRVGPWAATVAWMLLIFVLSSQSKMPAWAPSFGFQDVFGHWAAYGILALLLRWALASSGGKHPAAWAFIAAVLYGLSDEFHQSFVPGRHPDPFDLFVDATGAALALLAFRALRPLRSRSR